MAANSKIEFERRCAECDSTLVQVNGWGVCPNGHGRLLTLIQDERKTLPAIETNPNRAGIGVYLRKLAALTDKEA